MSYSDEVFVETFLRSMSSLGKRIIRYFSFFVGSLSDRSALWTVKAHVMLVFLARYIAHGDIFHILICLFSLIIKLLEVGRRGD